MVKQLKLDRKTRYTRMALQNSLIELMREKPISKITIKELCENADINRTTFYAHYNDQYDLLRKIEDETLSWVKERLGDLLAKTDKYEAMAVLEGIFQYFVENRSHLQVLMSEQGDIDFQKQLLTLIYQECGINFPGDDVDTNDYFIFVVTGSVGLIQHWLKGGLDKSPREMAETIFNIAFQIDKLPLKYPVL